MNMLLDDTLVASEHMAKQDAGSLPSTFLNMSSLGTDPGKPDIPFGAISQGSHNLKIIKGDTLTLNSWRFDGFLLYDGTPILPSAPVDTGSGYYWLPNPASADSPVINEIVSAVINIDGLEVGNVVEYKLDGHAYVPGTSIGVGNHELVVSVFADSSLASDRIAFSGANFTIVPEPMTACLAVSGLFFTMIIKRKKI